MANLFLQYSKPFYFSGQTIQAVALLNVFQTLVGTQLVIKIKGWQTVRWVQTLLITQQQQINMIPGHLIYNANNPSFAQDTSDSSDSQIQLKEKTRQKQYFKDQWGQIHKVIRYQGENIIIKFKTSLYHFSGDTIPQGQYSFPFSFKSNQSWPSSYIDKSLSKDRKGRIKYEIKASIQGINSKKKKQIKCKNQLIIRQSVSIQAQVKQMNVNLITCCIFNKGITKIKCFFDKNAYLPGQQSIIYCHIDNTLCKVKIEQIQISLINQITYTSQKNHSKSLTNVLLTKIFGGLGAGQKQQKSQQIKILNQKSANKMDIKPTARGRYLKSIYYIQVQAKFDANCICCSQSPTFRQSVLIYPYINPSLSWQQPAVWKPKVIQNISLNLDYNSNNQQILHMKNLYY